MYELCSQKYPCISPTFLSLAPVGQLTKPYFVKTRFKSNELLSQRTSSFHSLYTNFHSTIEIQFPIQIQFSARPHCRLPRTSSATPPRSSQTTRANQCFSLGWVPPHLKEDIHPVATPEPGCKIFFVSKLIIKIPFPPLHFIPQFFSSEKSSWFYCNLQFSRYLFFCPKSAH